MKKIVSFDQIKKSGYQGLKGAVSVAFPSHFHMQIIDGTGLPYGTVSVDGEESGTGYSCRMVINLSEKNSDHSSGICHLRH